MSTVLTIVVVWLATAVLLGVAWSLIAISLRRRRPAPPPQPPLRPPRETRRRTPSEPAAGPMPRLPRQRGKRR